MTKLDIVIPVFNAKDCVESLLSSVFATGLVGNEAHVFLVDDCSAVETANFLDEFSQLQDGVTLLRNETNQGYTVSLNRGISAGKSPYVIQLNSDCIVSRHSLRKLMSHLDSNGDLFGVSPMSNAGSFQSIPRVLNADGTALATNTTLEGMSIDEMDRFCGVYGRGLAYTQLLNGFCVMYNRRLLEEVGLPDEKLFPRGYGEEDDLHLRATAAGYLLAIATDAYVYHQKTQSFTSSEKAELSRRGRKLNDTNHGTFRLKRLTRSLRVHPRLEAIRIPARHVQSAHSSPMKRFLEIDWARASTERTSGLTSVVMPVYRHAEMTRQAIVTLLDSLPQTTEVEFIAVLNGADEETSQVVQELKTSYDFTVVDTGENYFFSMACNIGFEASRGDKVIFVNNDMIFHDSGWLPSIVANLDNPEVGCASVKLLFEDLSIQSAGFTWGKGSFFPVELGKFADSATLTGTIATNGVTGACLGVRAADFAALRGMDPIYINGSEDIDFCLKMRLWLGKPSLVNCDHTVIHLESKSPNRSKMVRENRTYFYERWAGSITEIAADLDDLGLKADTLPQPIRMQSVPR